ncbi:hypothetical protein [Riemerella columbipharyngis]|uniref:Uncharacterized protein n=1 Tax=Riemerella columbipharyngis TaxID=1071918 RepID=A0A1G7AN70_9FLAO|nr:hypothetical protein [Riemerella columbipharyngis]SDE15326.1 hypothetical protein SAMN05421544_1049 [Riemerella columbipharyngis]
MGQICHHFGWTLDYLLWGVDWRIVQRMLIDAPNYGIEEKEEKEISLKEQSAEDLKMMLERYK